MSKNAKFAIIAVVILAAMAILIKPVIDAGYTHVTAEPDLKLNQALNEEKPIFLELYSEL